MTDRASSTGSRNTTGKFAKYFEGKGEVSTVAKGNPRGTPVSVYDAITNGKKIETIPDNSQITVIPGKSYQPKYFCIYKKNKRGFINNSSVGKPKAAGVNPAFNRLTAVDFVSVKRDSTFCYQDKEIASKIFTAKDIEDSIFQSIKKDPAISDGIEESIMSLLGSTSYSAFNWDESVTDAEKKKLGAYFGEVLIGLLALKEKRSAISPVPWLKKPTQFVLPTDVSFSGVDSFLTIETGEVIPISNKAGRGSPASFFSNLVPYGIKNFNNLPACVFRDLVEASIRTSTNGKVKAKKALYEFGIRNILKIPVREIRDTYSVFEAIKSNIPSDERNLVISKIANFPGIEPSILQKLESSTTAFFCRVSANMLNKDRVSMDIMTKILSGKAYWQANLNLPKWNKGQVSFSMVKAGTARLKIIGNMASMSDLNAEQGMINYDLSRV